MYLLDTNVLSELRKDEAGRADARVSCWARGVSSQDLYLSVVTLLELEIGALSMERRDHRQGIFLRRWIADYVQNVFAERIIALDAAVAIRCAALHVPNKKPERDAWIAATALTHGMTVVTRNVKDFEDTGVTVFDPWTY